MSYNKVKKLFTMKFIKKSLFVIAYMVTGSVGIGLTPYFTQTLGKPISFIAIVLAFVCVVYPYRYLFKDINKGKIPQSLEV